MWQLYVYSLLAGMIGANGVPHFVKGVSGEKHQTPFGRSSSAVVNIVWGWVNIVVAGLVLHYAHPRAHEVRASVMFMVGVLVMGLALAGSTRLVANKK